MFELKCIPSWEIAGCRDATRFYRRLRKLPMVFNVIEHTTRDATPQVRIWESLGGAFYRGRHTVAFDAMSIFSEWCRVVSFQPSYTIV